MDKRYTIDLEYDGHEKAQYVVRFCGDWVGSRPTLEAARKLRDTYHSNRMRKLTA